MTRASVRHILSILLLGLAVFVVRTEYSEVVPRISVYEVVVASGLCLLIFLVSGLKISFLTSRRVDCRLRALDVLTLPVAMNLSSYLVPIKGGLIYLILFLKAKYGVRLVEGVSITAYNHLATLVFYGLVVLCYSLSQGQVLSTAGLLGLGLLLCPLAIPLLQRATLSLPRAGNSIVGRLQSIADDIVAVQRQLWSDFRTMAALLVLVVLHTALRISWIYFATVALGFKTPFLAVVAMALLTELSIIVRFLPGNLGVYELLSGGAFEVLADSAQTGILIALFLRLITLLVTFTIGLLALNLNAKYFEVGTFTSIWNTLAKNDTDISI